MSRKVTAIVGTYRKGHVIDKIVDCVLNSSRENGAETQKIYLLDKKIEFCINCRKCTQEPGIKRGKCIHNDDMDSILDTIEDSDSIVLASPINFGTVTALNKIFIERLICYTYWPWGAPFPKPRSKKRYRKAVLISASGAPSLFIYLLTGIFKTLKDSAKIMGAKEIKTLCAGMMSIKENPELSARVIRKAKNIGAGL